ncbi:hypothetical protein EZV62_011919 [Acer yangbiense]|uniref:J domain-containing protein n=1 Tax=Acer yangbiense TaxID=1000413 RepID=A0A5C7I6Z7_9ROSI|nr:hypothetical protein EZV62_011919 [Acer yangbiense]
MDMDVNRYEVLGLPSGVEGAKLTEKEISKAYKLRALELHPDKDQAERCVFSWRPPDMERYKVNCDAALDMEGNMVGIRLVIRDSEGNVMARHIPDDTGFEIRSHGLRA